MISDWALPFIIIFLWFFLICQISKDTELETLQKENLRLQIQLVKEQELKGGE